MTQVRTPVLNAAMLDMLRRICREHRRDNPAQNDEDIAYRLMRSYQRGVRGYDALRATLPQRRVETGPAAPLA